MVNVGKNKSTHGAWVHIYIYTYISYILEATLQPLTFAIKSGPTIHHPSWTPINLLSFGRSDNVCLSKLCGESPARERIDGEPPTKRLAIWIRGHDKPRLMGVAPRHLLSRWYISMMTKNPQGIMHLRWCKISAINSSRDSSDSFRPNNFLWPKLSFICSKFHLLLVWWPKKLAKL